MGKLDVIILKYGNAVLDLPKTNDPIGKPLDAAVQEIKDLMLNLVNALEQDLSGYDSLSPKDYVSSEGLREEIEAL